MATLSRGSNRWTFFAVASVLAMTMTALAEGAPDEVAPDEGLGVSSPSAATPSATKPSSSTVDTGRSDASSTTKRPERTDDEVPAPLSAADAFILLRAYEGKLSVGEPLSVVERRALLQLLTRDSDERVRAQAAGVVAWLPPSEALASLVSAMSDESALVRAQAATALSSFAPKMRDAERDVLIEGLAPAVGDSDDEVACAAVRALKLADAKRMRAVITPLLESVSDVRHACFSLALDREPREINVIRPVVRQKSDPGHTVVDTAPDLGPDPLGGLGTGLFIATATTAGIVAAGLLVPTLVPPRDTLIYSRTSTRHGREEPNILLTLGAAALGGAALGGAAWGVTALTDGVGFAPAASTAAVTVSGGAFGFGLGLALNLDEPLAGGVLMGSTVGGLLLGSTMSLVLPPTTNDVTLVSATAGAFALFGTLATYCIVPVGYPTVLFGAKRNDFAVGVGLMSGAAATVVALLTTPLVDFSHGRIMAASGAALATAMTGMAVSYLLTPVNVDIRSRIAAGVGTGLGVTSGLLVFALLPSSWANALESVDTEVGREALVIDEGEVRLGLPTIWVIPEDQLAGTAAEFGVSLVGGRF